MSSRLHLGALWVVSCRERGNGQWSYHAFTAKKAATKYADWVLDSGSADSTVGPRRFVPRNAPVKRDKKGGGSL